MHDLTVSVTQLRCHSFCTYKQAQLSQYADLPSSLVDGKIMGLPKNCISKVMV